MTPKKVPVEVFVQNAAAFASPAECLREIVLAYTEYKTVAEEERTKRRGIEAWEKATIAQIKAQRDFLIDYLNRSFDERFENFAALFGIVAQAMAEGNNAQIGSALHSITELAKSSPFKDLGDLASVKAALDDPDHEWTF